MVFLRVRNVDLLGMEAFLVSCFTLRVSLVAFVYPLVSCRL